MRGTSRGPAWFVAALRLSDELKIPLFAGMMRTNLGRVARSLDEDDEALRLHREGMRLTWRYGWQRSIPESLEALARLTAGAWEPARTVAMFSAAHRLRDRLGMEPASGDEPYLAATQADLGEATFAAVWAEGSAMPIEQAVAEALASETPNPASSPRARSR